MVISAFADTRNNGGISRVKGEQYAIHKDTEAGSAVRNGNVRS
jgi:hypothetical protein